MSSSQNEILATPPSFASSTETQHELECSNTNFAFLVHSRDTFNLPPSVDNKSLARQRRKRTSPEDQAILEEEFHRDPKPDRFKRQRIVERVALGDKEVQIWFQNRRQSKRRKSQAPVSYDMLPRLEPATATNGHLAALVYSTSNVSSSQDLASSNEELGVVRTPSTSQYSLTSTSNHDGTSQNSEPNSRMFTASSSPATDSSAEKIFEDDNASQLNESVPFRVVPESQDSIRSVDSASNTRGSHSKVRLSMTSDGGAKILGGKDSTPSPPRSQPLAPTPFHTRQTLRRSYSNASMVDSRDKSGPNLLRLLERKPSGHSRDSRAWEFWCDPDARNELIVKAHKDSSGSAADAIRLIRSNSAGKRSIASTSVLCPTQSLGGADKVQGEKIIKRNTPGLRGYRDEERRPSGSGSDKENNSPAVFGMENTRGSQSLTYSLGYSERVVLGESRAIGACGFGKIGLGIQPDLAGTNKERSSNDGSNENTDYDDEVVKFMRGAKSNDVCRGGEPWSDKTGEECDDEMDCVASLLSLSKGNWR